MWSIQQFFWHKGGQLRLLPVLLLHVTEGTPQRTVLLHTKNSATSHRSEGTDLGGAQEDVWWYLLIYSQAVISWAAGVCYRIWSLSGLGEGWTGCGTRCSGSEGPWTKSCSNGEQVTEGYYEETVPRCSPGGGWVGAMTEGLKYELHKGKSTIGTIRIVSISRPMRNRSHNQMWPWCINECPHPDARSMKLRMHEDSRTCPNRYIQKTTVI